MDMKAIHLQRGENIANIRKRCGYTQEQLAELLGISKSYLAHVEQGDAQFSVDTLWRFVTTLHVSADEVFFGRDTSSQAKEILTMLDKILFLLLTKSVKYCTSLWKKKSLVDALPP